MFRYCKKKGQPCEICEAGMCLLGSGNTKGSSDHNCLSEEESIRR